MAKFYVESGSFRGVVDSYDEESAAVWAVHRVMERAEAPRVMERDEAPATTVGPVTSDDATPNADIGLFRLGDEIRVSERGFRRRDALRIPTKHAFLRWIQLLHAIESLTHKMNDALDGI